LEKVNALESCLLVLKFTMDPEDYWARLQEFDKARKLSYNGLIANIKLLNRYCKLDEIDPIYSTKYSIARVRYCTIRKPV